MRLWLHAGPGLLGSLFVGWEFAKGLSIALDVPLLGVHHMMAHALSPMGADQPATFPYLCLNVSGGHTQFVMVRDWHEVEVLGGTLDDAVGEAFDKAAKMLGLPYPGGPNMDKMAKEGNPLKYTFSRPKTEGLDFSFSGVKTSIRYFLEKRLNTIQPLSKTIFVTCVRRSNIPWSLFYWISIVMR